MEPRTECMKKYLVNEYRSWGTYALWGMLAFTIIFGFVFVVWSGCYLYDRFSPALRTFIGWFDIPYLIYLAIMIFLLYMFTIHIAKSDRSFFKSEWKQPDGTIVNAPLTATGFCAIGLLAGVITTEIVGLFFVSGIWPVLVLAVYSLCILVFTPPCCAWAWCKGDPESPTDSLQQPPEPETENPPLEWKNPAGNDPTPQGIDIAKIADTVLTERERQRELERWK